jgi:hypothetical protein
MLLLSKKSRKDAAWVESIKCECNVGENMFYLNSFSRFFFVLAHTKKENFFERVEVCFVEGERNIII